MMFSELIDSFDEVILILDLKILLILASFETLDFFDLGVPEETSKVGDSKTVVSSKTGARFACLINFRMNLKPTRDVNSSENFILRGIEESRNGKMTFFEDRGVRNLFLGVLGEFRGTILVRPSKTNMGCYRLQCNGMFFHSATQVGHFIESLVCNIMLQM